MREKLIELLDGIQSHGWRRIETDHSITLAVVENKAIAEHLIANGVTIQRWIPVTERLPEEVLEESWDEKPHTASALVLVAVRDDCDRRFVSDDITFDGKWCNYPSPDFEVTHWMPLPEPPKEG